VRALIEDVMWRSGLRDPAAAVTALELVVDALPPLLRPEEARFVASSLPREIAERLATSRPRERREPRGLYERLSVAEHVDLGGAIELARAAYGALAEACGYEQRVLLARRLPSEWAALFESQPRVPGSRSRGTVPGHGHTLATGRPGSLRTFAESTPPSRAQAGSVAAENPHGDTKLSSATGPGSTPLARAQPRAEEPMAERRDERSTR
jgi:uncharacterized protein (DUF2267 family)